ncbi:unnamed protein product [Brassica napus]|uniref:(rape) hypothetical protein n=1 Tax=Brassica napus TaxID=3708 RepID=A0A816VXX7_BRANA|nr:unnamed protein product [Brassica napus]
MAFLSRDETKPFVWSFIVDSASLSRALSLLRRVDGIKRCSLVDGINRRRCRCTRRISPSSRRNQAESIADHSTTPRLSLSPRLTPRLSPSPRREPFSLPLLDDAASQSLSALTRIER